MTSDAQGPAGEAPREAPSLRPRPEVRAVSAGGLRQWTRRPVAVLAAVVLLAALAGHLSTRFSSPIDGWGWDESMHAALPAARMVVGVQEGRWDLAGEALLDCERYPFVFPLVLAAGQSVLGLGQDAARVTAFLFWVFAGLLGFALLARAIAADLEGPERLRAPELVLVTLALVSLSPLAWRFAPSLFLELPFTIVAAYAVLAWTARRSSVGGGRRRQLLAGALVTAALFTKFNYGVLLCAGLALDLLVDLWQATRTGRLAAALGNVPWLASPLLLTLAWWLVLPWPGDLELAARHRGELLSFLTGNLASGATPWTLRALDWTTGFTAHPLLFVVVLFGVGASLRRRRSVTVRTLWILLLVMGVALAAHPFHLDRFLIPLLLPALPLAAAGLVPDGPGSDSWARPTLGLGAVFAVCLLVPRHVVAGWLGIGTGSERLAQVIDERWGLFGAVPTAGLQRVTLEKALDLVAAEVGPQERVGWVGMSTELSPAALHLGLLERGGSTRRFLRDSHRRMDLVPIPGAEDPLGLPSFTQAAERDRFLEERFSSFDVLIFSSPPDLKDRAGRRRLYPDFHAPLVEVLGYEPEVLGEVSIQRANDRLPVSLVALRLQGR